MPGDKGGESINSVNQQTALTPGFVLKTSNRGGGAFLSELTSRGGPADDRLPRILSDIDTLRGSITPGASALRAARLSQVESGRQRAISNLRDNLARRRVAGSSFANDVLLRGEREFAQAKAQEEGKSFLEEFSLNTAALNQETAVVLQALDRELKALGIASGSLSSISSLNVQTELANAQLSAQAAQGRGQLAGSIVGLAATPFLGPIGAAAGSQVAGSLFGTQPLAQQFPTFNVGGALGLA